MTNYVARRGGQKKKNILRQRELELIGLMSCEDADAKITRAAERVRAAQLGVIKVLLKEATPVAEEDEPRYEPKRRKLAEKRSFWNQVSPEEIVRLYEGQSPGGDVERKRWGDFRQR